MRKQAIYLFTLTLVIVGGVVFANLKSTSYPGASLRPLSAAEKKAANEERIKWEASPDGQKLKKWDASPEGIRVHLSADKIRKNIRDHSNIEAVVTSLSYPSGGLGGFGVMVRVGEEDYILNVQPERPNNFFINFNEGLQGLSNLKVNDKIIIKSRNTSYAPKYPYLIISGDYVERDHKTVFKGRFSNDGC